MFSYYIRRISILFIITLFIYSVDFEVNYIVIFINFIEYYYCTEKKTTPLENTNVYVFASLRITYSRNIVGTRKPELGLQKKKKEKNPIENNQYCYESTK